MENTSKIIPCYSADTAGVCSAMYELGGMTVVHDASGCNSTYSTHDEPRWYDKKSRIFISALTEEDAVMGNDEKLIDDVVSAAKDLSPEFITLCGSPMPMMTGVDFDAVAAQIEELSGIRTFGLRTNGMHSYLQGAAEAFLALAKEYVKETPKTPGIGVNVLGLTPLDFGITGMAESIMKWLDDCGFEPVAAFAMGSSLEDIRRAASARVNLVVSYSGLKAAKYMLKEFDIPYVCGVPVGEKFARTLAQNMWLVVNDEIDILYPCAERRTDEEGVQVIGESIFAGSVAAALSGETGRNARVICPLDTEPELLARGDIAIASEEAIEAELKKDIRGVIADGMYKLITPAGTDFCELPHFAFSGRAKGADIPDLINRPFKEFYK